MRKTGDIARPLRIAANLSEEPCLGVLGLLTTMETAMQWTVSAVAYRSLSECQYHAQMC